ncbi:NAD(P)-binding protein [Pseudomonas sp. DB1]|uniref:NAD(P)-binding protein n=1 Tax=Metapseudomonas boanensis TaxID=2822138 RepID=A0ABS5XL45_9GAMM|nr:NAD(P)-binding protein [Pseudomonas boanensis]
MQLAHTNDKGLGMAIRLKQKGENDFLMLEKEAEIGGTWRVNNDPGCGCDVQSHLYSFSFEPNPNWTRMFAKQDEIKTYLKGCRGKHCLQDQTLLETEIIRLTWHERIADPFDPVSAPGHPFHAPGREVLTQAQGGRGIQGGGVNVGRAEVRSPTQRSRAIRECWASLSTNLRALPPDSPCDTRSDIRTTSGIDIRKTGQRVFPVSMPTK